VFYRNEHQYNLTEESPIGPAFINQYARTKYLGEQLVRSYEGSSVILRPRAVFGPGDTVLFPRILKAAKLGRLPLFVTNGEPARGDLIYIETLCDYILKVALKPDLADAYNVTNNKPVIIQDFLLEILRRLKLPAPTRRFHVNTAFKLAGMLEGLYALLRLPGEPAITRFGVSVFAYSKTFNVDLALSDLGPPLVGLDEGVNRFIAWQLEQ
jgi:nucleoside-diphosphate-sugar epimerase